jgi:uncharacterized protein
MALAIALPLRALRGGFSFQCTQQRIGAFALVVLRHAATIARCRLQTMDSQRRSLLAHVLPMVLFIALLAGSQLLPNFGNAFALRHAEFWVYPGQTVLCGCLLLRFWRCYQLGPLRNIRFVLLVATAVFLIWISPQQFLGFSSRKSGFDPILVTEPAVYWLTVVLRFLRLVIVVPLVEEIFWRAFLLRFFIEENFERVPFGKFTWLSFTVVSVAFALSHSRLDWPAALVAGALYNLIAYRTGSLASCVLAHGFTNLLLGFWIMQTKQWGFW